MSAIVIEIEHTFIRAAEDGVELVYFRRECLRKDPERLRIFFEIIEERVRKVLNVMEGE